MEIVIYVQKTETCTMLLKYIKQNIEEFKSRFKLTITKITDKKHAQKLNVNQTPSALIGGTMHVGFENIKQLLNGKSIQPIKKKQQQQKRQKEQDEQEDYMMSIATEGMKKNGEKIVFQDEESATDRRSAELAKKLEEYQKMTKKTNTRKPAKLQVESDSVDEQPKQQPQKQRPKQKSQYDFVEEEGDEDEMNDIVDEINENEEDDLEEYQADGLKDDGPEKML